MKRLGTFASVTMLAVLGSGGLFGCVIDDDLSYDQRGAVAGATAQTCLAATALADVTESRTYCMTKAQLDNWFMNGSLGKKLYDKLGKPDTSKPFSIEKSMAGHTIKIEWDPAKGKLKITITGRFAKKAADTIEKEIKQYGGTVATCSAGTGEQDGSFGQFCADVFGTSPDGCSEPPPDESLCDGFYETPVSDIGCDF